MPRVTPFRGIYFNQNQIRDLGMVITPPYDVIPKSEEKKYLDRSPYNFAHIILPKEGATNYLKEAETLQRWQKQNILKKDSKPHYYLYRQIFEIDGKKHARETLMCAVKLEEFSNGGIRPHENTHGKYKADRLQILKETQHNLSHIFGMVRDEEGFLRSLFEKSEYTTPILKGVSDDSIEHVVWQMDPGKTTSLEAFFLDHPIYIVDGHHRYEASLQYARELGVLGNESHPAAHMLFAVASHHDPALLIFPTHRAIRSKESFKWDARKIEEKFDFFPYTEEELRTFVASPRKNPEFVILVNNQLSLCRPKNWENAALAPSRRHLSVEWSDNQLLNEYCSIGSSERAKVITYLKDFESLCQSRSEYSLIIFHAPPRADQVIQIADENQFMPQKSTYFYPKLYAGLIMRELVH